MKDGMDGAGPAKVGYHKKAFGPQETVNHRIDGAYHNQPSGHDAQATSIHEVVKHHPDNPMFSDAKGQGKGPKGKKPMKDGGNFNR